MQLPQFQDNSLPFQLMQNQWGSILNPIISNPINLGSVLKNVSLINGTTVVNHLLARKLQGWKIIGINAAATIYDAQATNQTPDKTLVLISSAACLVNLEVF